mmetsp:Transcript_14453/g.31346  ORF Transcript_14453/g.31346 Transcript_14453/m.31346 type:complete len:242 (+) Transcript_14453:1416-2141(+)
MVLRVSFVSEPPVMPTYVTRLERRSRHEDRDSTSVHSLVNRYNAGAVGSTIEWSSDGEPSHCGSSASMAWTQVSRTVMSFSAERADASIPKGLSGDDIVTWCALHERSHIIRRRRMGSWVCCCGLLCNNNTKHGPRDASNHVRKWNPGQLSNILPAKPAAVYIASHCNIRSRAAFSPCESFVGGAPRGIADNRIRASIPADMPPSISTANRCDATFDNNCINQGITISLEKEDSTKARNRF